MSFPKPGKPVRGSKSGSSIMALFDLLGRSWGMGIIWQLQNGPCNFRELQEKCETISPTTLNKRLKELKSALIITRTVEGYALTDNGKELLKLIHPLKDWSYNWAKNFIDNK